MSSNETFPAPRKKNSNETCSGITKSLFSRQLLSSFLITILGLSILSGLYYFSKKQSYLEDVLTNSRAIDDYIVGLLTYNSDTGRYYIEPEYLKKAKEKFKKYKLTQNIDQKFAYIINADNNQLIWHSQAMDSVNYKDASRPPYPPENLNALPILKSTKQINKGKNELEILPAKNAIRGRKNTKNHYYIAYHSLFSQDDQNFHLVIAESTREMDKNKSELLQHGVLILITSFLVFIAQLVSGYLVITPIKRFENEIKDIESGKQEFIEGRFPTELLQVKGAINALVRVEKGQKKRYRDSLDNLAHSLKTPLAVLQGFAESNDSLTEQQSATLINQISQMTDIIAYQLRRATINDHNSNIKRQRIRPILYRLKATFLKVHHKSFEIQINVDENAECRMDKDDLMEVFGNLISNACRFCEKIVSVTATQNGETITIDIDDDGLGFPDKNPSDLLKRGIRADSQTEGQGIGMAVSNEIIEAAGGKIELRVSPYIGARVRLHLPV